MSANNELNYLETLVNEMREKEAQAKALQDEIDAVKSLIKDTMDTEGLSEVTTTRKRTKAVTYIVSLTALHVNYIGGDHDGYSSRNRNKYNN